MNETDCDVCLFNRHFVSLLGDDADHVAELALHGELSDGLHDILALQGCHGSADAETAQIAER